MINFIKFMIYGMMLSATPLILLALIGPYEDSTLATEFDAAQLEQGIDAYLTAQETGVQGITPGVEKRVIWHGEPEQCTEWAVLYIHGFSATSEEIRPVPDQVAKALGANLVFTRLTGHGRDGDALAQATVADWMRDTAEALAVARAVGDKVLVISTSTGGTLSTAAAVDPTLAKDVAAMVLISPNFGIQNPLAPLLTFPAARYWLPVLADKERSFEPANADQAKYWTTSYPSVAALPLAALVQEVRGLDLSAVTIPALFWYAKTDMVVRPDVTNEMAERWGGAVTVVNPQLGPDDDPGAHVIAGDIMSPSQTGAVVSGILTWLEGL